MTSPDQNRTPSNDGADQGETNAPDAAARRPGAFVLLCAIGFLGRLSYEMARSPLTALYAAHLGAPAAVIGLLVAAVTVTGIFVKLPSGALADLFGFRRLMLAGLCVKATAPFLYLVVAAWPQLLALRLYHGLSTALYAPAASARVASLYPEARGRRLGLYGAAENAGVVLGPVLGAAVLAWVGFTPAFVVSGLIGVAALLALLPLPGGGAPERSGASRHVLADLRRGLAQILGDPGIRLASLAEGALYAGVGMLQAYLPLYATGIGIRVVDVGWLFGVQGVASILLRGPMGALGDRVGRHPVIVSGMSLCILCLAAVPWCSDYAGLLALCAAFGAGTAMVTPSTTALIGDRATRGGYGAAMGVFGSLWDVGHAGGPILAGPLIGWLGYRIAFPIVAAAIASALACFVLGGDRAFGRPPMSK
ncbi:MFS transporter [Lichenibacterium dinghuense]|uniref:MFS transporter n=1 Tax=Lichenibacterium dinghuense TaxID=2895977 RepID=UPI001F31E742|nr:MFS transporter [Lichenibacterium sp. 6Y81]